MTPGTGPTSHAGGTGPAHSRAGAPTIEDLAGAGAHEAQHRLRGLGAVVRVDAIDGWLVLARDAAVEAMRDAATFTVDDPRFTTGQVVGPSMLSLDGDEHGRHRTPFRSAYAARTLGPLRDFSTAEARRLCDELAPAGRADLRLELAAPLATSVIHRSLGIRGTSPDRMLSWYRSIVASVSALTAGEALDADGPSAMGELRSAVARTLMDDPESMLGRLVDQQLSTDEIAQNAAIVLFGAIETVEGMVANLLHHVLSTDGAAALLSERSETIEIAVEESLRLEPAATVIDRYATRDVEFFGAPIAEGDLVRISLAAANRDPAVFDRPDVFDLTRPNSGLQVGFALGPHACIGAHLSRIEAAAALSAALERFPNPRLLPDATPPTGLVFRKPERLPVAWD